MISLKKYLLIFNGLNSTIRKNMDDISNFLCLFWWLNEPKQFVLFCRASDNTWHIGSCMFGIPDVVR